MENMDLSVKVHTLLAELLADQYGFKIEKLSFADNRETPEPIGCLHFGENGNLVWRREPVREERAS